MIVTPSILKNIFYLTTLLDKRTKITLLAISCLSLITAALEMVCAGATVMLTQSLIQPSEGVEFVKRMGVTSPTEKYAFLLIGGGLLLAYFLKNIFSILDVSVQNLYIRKLNCDYQRKILNLFQNIDYETISSRHSSYGITVVSGDTEVVFSKGFLPLTNIISEGIILLGLISFLAYINIQLFFIFSALCLSVSIVIILLGFPILYKIGQKNQAASLKKNIAVTKYFQGYKEILLSGKSQYFINEYLGNLAVSTKAAALNNIFSSFPRTFIEFTFLGSFIISLAFVDLNAGNLGFLGAYAYSAFRIMPGLNRIINHFSNLKSSIPFIQRFIKEYRELQVSKAYMDCPDLQFNHTITFNGVSFSYKTKGSPVLLNMDLTIRKGDFIGIVGPTGSGKSTLTNMLLGLLKPEHGNVLIDQKYPAHSRQWHEKVGYVPQSIYLIDGSIEENIAFGYVNDGIDTDRVYNVCKEAQIDDFVRRLPLGLKSRVGEFGSSISGGERQRIAIARALYKNPEVLIFDEATSALDSETERTLIDTICTLQESRTIVMIAHRLESLRYCNRILRVENALVEEVGSYELLRARADYVS